MNRIDQNFYQNDELSFGPLYTDLRMSIWNYRWDVVFSILSEKYPEYTIKIMGKKSEYSYLTTFPSEKMGFKAGYKLYYALYYSMMERVDANEFKIITKKFKRYLNYSESSKIELKTLFTN